MDRNDHPALEDVASAGDTAAAPRRRYHLWSPERLHGASSLLIWLLIELWLLNVADFALTAYGIWLGFAIEANSVMAYFLNHGTLVAAAFKLGIVTIGCLVLWLARRHKAALLAAIILTIAFAAVATYQVLWLTNFAG